MKNPLNQLKNFIQSVFSFEKEARTIYFEAGSRENFRRDITLPDDYIITPSGQILRQPMERRSTFVRDLN